MPQYMIDNIPPLVKASSTTLTLASTYLGQSTVITVGGQSYLVPATLTLNAATVGANGLDAGTLGNNQNWYVYAVVNQSAWTVAIVASLNAPAVGLTHPSGYGTAEKLIGGFSTNGSANITNTSTILQVTQRGGTGAWKSHTPTGPFNTNTTYTGKYREVGTSVELRIQVAFSGAPNVATFLPTPVQLLNGTGYSINNSDIVGPSLALISVGTWSGFDSGINPAFGGVIAYDGSNFYLNYSTGTATAVSVTNAQPVAFNNTDALTLVLTIPVNELATGSIFGTVS